MKDCSLNLNYKNTNNPVKKWAKDLNRDFAKEVTQMANKYMKTCCTLCIIREIKINTIRYIYVPIRMGQIQDSENYICWWEYRATETLIPNDMVTLEDNVLLSIETKHTLLYDPAITSLGIHPETLKMYIHTKLAQMLMPISAWL